MPDEKATLDPTPPTSKEGAAGEEGAGAADKGAEDASQKEKTYTEGQWNLRQSKLDGQASSMKKERDEAITRLGDLETTVRGLQDRTEESTLNDWLKEADRAGVDEDFARRIATREKNSREKVTAAEDSRKSYEVKAAELNEGLKHLKIERLAVEFKLTEEDKKELALLTDPRDVEVKALRMGLESRKAGEKPPETPPGPKAGSKGVDLSTLPPTRALGYLLEAKEAELRG